MNNILSRYSNEQYAYFRGELEKKWGIAGSSLKSHDARLKGIYRRYLSLACAATIVGRKTRAREYLDGVIEVCYLAQVLAVKGLENPMFVLLRQSIELVLKYIFFMFHPVEFHWAATREGYRDINFQLLLEFVKQTEEHKEFSKFSNLAEEINKIYSIMSKHVHVLNRGFMRYNKIGSSFLPNATILKKFDATTKELWPILIKLMIIYFPDKYHNAQDIERKLIMNSFKKQARGFTHKYLSRYSKSRYL